VKLTGEDPEEVEDLNKAAKDPRNFMSKSPFQRGMVLVAGVVMNFLLAITLFYIVLISNGFKTSYMPMYFDYNFRFGQEESLDSVVVEVMEGSPAEKADIRPGEAIIEINGNPVASAADVRRLVKGLEGQAVNVVLQDVRQANTVIRNVSVEPAKDEEGEEMLGVYLSRATRVNYSGFPQSIFSGLSHSYNVMGYSLKGLSYIVGISVENKSLQPVSQSVAGPVGIYSIVGGVLEMGGSRVLLNILDFMGVMSISLAFINVMPFPALDGGRLFFVIVEGITKKKLNPALEVKIHKAGFAFLLALLVLVTIKDIATKLF